MQQKNYQLLEQLQFQEYIKENKDQHITPIENYLFINNISKQQLLERVQYLQRKCQYLQVQNEGLKDQIKRSQKIQIKIQIFEKNQHHSEQSNIQSTPTSKIKAIDEKVTKKRRTQKQLNKDFKCPYLGCQKEYASALALNLHMRVKHGGGTKKQRKQFIKKIINAQLNGEELPKTNLNLPPNYIQEKKRLILSCQQYQKTQSSKNIKEN